MLQGAHTAGFNSVGYGVCFLGDFTLKQPTQVAIQVKSLLKIAVYSR